MHIDPFSIIVFNIIASFLISAGALYLLKNHFIQVKGILHWAISLLLQVIGWVLMILSGVIPDFFSITLGSTLIVLAVALYFHALVRFKESSISVQWVYFLVALGFIGNIYFVHIHFNLDAKIAVTSITLAILLCGNSILLFSNQSENCTASHRFTGSIFAFAGFVSLLRSLYYLFWHTQGQHSLLHSNFIQDIFYLVSAITLIGVSFGFALICNDTYIMEKNWAQSARQEALERLHKISSRVPGVVYQFKMSAEGHFNVPYCSDGIYDVFKVHPEQIIEDASPLFKKIHPDDYEMFIASVLESAEKLTAWFCEFRVKFDDGQVHWLGGNSMPQLSSDGSILWHGFISDITERKTNEEQLLILSVATEQSPTSVMITDPNGKLLYVNPKFTESTGYSSEEILGKNPHILKSGSTPKAVYNQLWQSLKRGEVWHGELLNQRKNGETYWDETYVAPVKNAEDVTTHYVGIKLDISARKEAEMELTQAKELAINANQAKSEFIANMSHEIRTPMNAVLGFSDILSDLITDKVQRYYLDGIKSSGKILLQLINDILDLSKIEAGKLELHYASVEIKSIFDDVRMMFLHKLTEKAIDFSCAFDKNIPPFLLLDEIRLRQVLLNLVSNAVKFTDKGFVRIGVTSQPVYADDSDLLEKPQHINLIITVSDSGMGIAVDQLEAVFNSFTQQKRQSLKYGGTGLGLTICKRLVEMMGGTISVTSELGVGSCFTVQLPKIAVAKELGQFIPEKKTSPKTVRFHPAYVLLVDDSEINRLVMRAYLDEYPELTVLEAESGTQALALLQQHSFDLILMDRIMPDEDGDSVCQKIKALSAYAAVPIVMISASVLTTQSSSQSIFYDLQLNKPVNKNELLAALQEFLHIDEATPISLRVQEEQVVATAATQIADPEKQQELLNLLSSRYQQLITKQNRSGIVQINTLIDIAEELLPIAEQYQCGLLSDWAKTLKTQARLFDLNEIPKTLTAFDALLKQLA